MDYIRAVLQWIFLLVANIITDIIGLPLVALTIPFRVPGKSLSEGRDIVNLPTWVHLFGNDYDGLLGDKRLWWAENCDAQVFFGLLPWLRTHATWLHVPVLTADSFWAMWWWAAVRNPVNNMRLYSWFQAPVVGSPITWKGDEHVRDKTGQGGWQFVTTENNGKKWYGYYLVKEYKDGKHAFVIRFGFKVEPSDAGSTEPQGMTTKINPYKDIT